VPYSQSLARNKSSAADRAVGLHDIFAFENRNTTLEWLQEKSSFKSLNTAVFIQFGNQVGHQQIGDLNNSNESKQKETKGNERPSSPALNFFKKISVTKRGLR
jgi:hypothetical protein